MTRQSHIMMSFWSPNLQSPVRLYRQVTYCSAVSSSHYDLWFTCSYNCDVLPNCEENVELGKDVLLYLFLLLVMMSVEVRKYISDPSPKQQNVDPGAFLLSLTILMLCGIAWTAGSTWATHLNVMLGGKATPTKKENTQNSWMTTQIYCTLYKPTSNNFK